MMKKKKLYKYGSMENPKHLKQTLIDNTLWFSDPKKFNDPFDFRPRIIFGKSKVAQQKSREFVRNILKKGEQSIPRDILEEYVELERRVEIVLNDPKRIYNILSSKYEELIKTKSVYCLSGKNDNLLMWSHYSKGHKGFCLEFSTYNKDFLGQAFEVEYRKEYPTVKLFDENFEESGKESCLVKSKDWEYEEEWRLFSKNPGLVSFPPESLTGLILGCKMCEQHIKQIKKWVSRRKTPLTLKLAKMPDREYKLNIVSL